MFVELTVLLTTLLGAALGGCSIYWVKVGPNTRRAWWGRRVFIGTLLSMGVTALLAALMHADGLSPLGLAAGMLIVGMLWESSAPALQDEI
jgi:hypothetical protein